jgi:hypothetical protein
VGHEGRGTETEEGRQAEAPRLVEKYVMIIECASETQQVEALRLCKEAGFPCRAVMS